MTRSSTNHPPLFDGPVLPVCSSCGSLEGGAYCSRCGEPADTSGSGWFVLKLATRNRKARNELSQLDSYPGKVLESGRMARIAVANAEQIQWLAENMPTASMGSAVRLVGSRGQTFSGDDPIFQCLMGVMDSRIRGCMTQKSRRAYCRRESALLPLPDPMKNYAWADVLEHAGKQAEAREMVTGVLAQLGGQSEKVACPLFGPSLRMSNRDMNRLPLLLSSLRKRVHHGPVVRVVSAMNPGDGQSQPALAPRIQGVNGEAWGESGPLMGAVSGDQALFYSPDGGGTTRWLTHDRFVSVENVPRLARVAPVGSGFALHYLLEGRSQGCALVLPPEEGAGGELKARLGPVGADSVATQGTITAVLQARRQRLTIAWHDTSIRSVQRMDWQVGLAFIGPYRLEILGPGRFLVIGARGGLAALTSEGGALLTPAQGIARFSSLDFPPGEFSGVVDAVALEDGTFAVLSCDGYRLSVARVERFRRVESPDVEILWDAVLPEDAHRLTTDGRQFLCLGTRAHVQRLRLSNGDVLDWQARKPWGTCLEGGGVIWPEGEHWNLERPAPTKSVNRVETILALVTKLVDRTLSAEGEVIPVLDRNGRFPHKFIWGT